MREIQDHKTNAANDAITIEVGDKPGAGGAHHRYLVSYVPGYVAGSSGMRECQEIIFQNGPIAERGVNGITQEALLAIVIDRLRSFQDGPFACMENQMALMFCRNALEWLKFRTTGRVRRGVEGTNQK